MENTNSSELSMKNHKLIMLDLSTAHVTQRTERLLNAQSEMNPEDQWINVYKKSDFGYFIHIDFASQELPHDLYRLMKYAKKEGAWWVLLDRDGAKVDNLQLHDW